MMNNNMHDWIDIDGQKYWPGFLTSDVEPMTKEMSKLFILSTMAEIDSNNNPIPQAIINLMNENFGIQILKSRLEPVGTVLSDSVLAFLIAFLTTPANAVMMAYTLNLARISQNLQNPITIDTLARIFPMGFPTDAAKAIAWDSQKLDNGSNLVDDYDYWPTKKRA